MGGGQLAVLTQTLMSKIEKDQLKYFFNTLTPGTIMLLVTTLSPLCTVWLRLNIIDKTRVNTNVHAQKDRDIFHYYTYIATKYRYIAQPWNIHSIIRIIIIKIATRHCLL